MIDSRQPPGVKGHTQTAVKLAWDTTQSQDYMSRALVQILKVQNP